MEEVTMLNGFRYLAQSAPANCAQCSESLARDGAHVVCWRTSNGQYFCSEFCADDAEEAAFQKLRRAS
jgi:hypothetical protein